MRSLICGFFLIISGMLLPPSGATVLHREFAINNETQIKINNLGLQTNHTAVSNKTQYQISLYGSKTNHPGHVDCLFKPPSAGCPLVAKCSTNCNICLRGFAHINSACYLPSNICVCHARTNRGLAVLHLVLRKSLLSADLWIMDQSFSPEYLKQLLKMAMQFVQERLSEESALKELFKKMATDNNGTITFAEWKDDLKRFASALKELKN